MPVDQTLTMEGKGVVLVRLRWQGTVLHKKPGQTFEISLVWLFEEYLFHWYIFSSDYGMKMQNHGQSFTLVLWLIKDKIPDICTKITVSKHMKTTCRNAVVVWRLFNSEAGHSFSWSSHIMSNGKMSWSETLLIFFSKSVNLVCLLS